MKITSKNLNQILPLVVGCFFLCCLVSVSFAQMLEAGQDKFSPGDDKNLRVIATVNNQKITVSDFKKEMIKQGGLSGKRFTNMDEKLKVLEELIHFKLFFSEAVQQGYDKNPEILESYHKQIVQKYLKEEIEPKLQKISISEEEIKIYYQENIDEYQKPSLAKLAIIWIKVPDDISQIQKEKLERKANEALIEAKKMRSPKGNDNSFGKLARIYSDDISSKYKGGTIGWFSKKDEEKSGIPKEVFNIALSLNELGAISNLILTPKGYYIVKLAGKKFFPPLTLEETKSQIRYKLYVEKKRSLYKTQFEKIKEDASISINYDLLDSINYGRKDKIQRNEQRPPSFPVN